jgi:hypothetical protein
MENEFGSNGTTAISVQAQSETNIASASARVQAETIASITVAQRFKRSESQARQELLNAVKASPRLAEKAAYSYKRGKRQDPVTNEWVDNIISGPSTYIAREAARVWGNVDYGTEVIRDTDHDRQIRSFAWDKQTNVRPIAEAAFKKLIQRTSWVTKNNKREKVTLWVEPDERDLRELSNKYASIGERNCLLKVIPSHMIDEVLEVARQVTLEDAAKHPEAVRAKLADAFLLIGINVAMLEDYFGHPLKDTTPSEIVDLRGIYTSIRENNSTWEDYRRTTLPSEDEVPEMPQLRELAKRIKWNEAKLSSEVGRHIADIPKLIALMSEQAAKSPIPPKAASAAVGTPKAGDEVPPLKKNDAAKYEDSTAPPTYYDAGEVSPQVISPPAAARRTRQPAKPAEDF